MLCNLLPNIGNLPTLINQKSTKLTLGEEKQPDSTEQRKVYNLISSNSKRAVDISIAAEDNLSPTDGGVIFINSNEQNDDDINLYPEEQGNIIISTNTLGKGNSGELIIVPESNSGNISISKTGLINIFGTNDLATKEIG